MWAVRSPLLALEDLLSALRVVGARERAVARREDEWGGCYRSYRTDETPSRTLDLGSCSPPCHVRVADEHAHPCCLAVSLPGPGSADGMLARSCLCGGGRSTALAGWCR